VLIYVAIMAAKLGRIERELTELTELAQRREADEPGAQERDREAVGSSRE
jgi:hypothetical protein